MIRAKSVFRLSTVRGRPWRATGARGPTRSPRRPRTRRAGSATRRGSPPSCDVSAPVSSPSAATWAWKPARSGSTTSSGRKVGTTRPAQPELAEPRVRLERVEGAVGRGEERDAETFEERAGPEVLLRQAGRDRRRTRRRRSSHRAAPSRRRPPGACGRARASTACRGRAGTCAASSRQICLPSVTTGAAVERPHPERLERHALAVEHAEDVVVLRHELGRRAVERRVLGQRRPGRSGRGG